MDDYDAQEIIDSFLDGGSPGYQIVETWVERVVRTRGWGRVSGEDVAQESLAILVANFRNNRYRGEGSLQGYVQRIAYIQCALAVREIKRGSLVQEDVTGCSGGARISTPEADALGQEELDIFVEVWMRLPDRCRRVLSGRFLDELSYKELAPRLGYSVGYCRRLKLECLRTAQKLAQEKFDG
jgi:RNA polymerase sigma factor (sigma-70 family)